MNPSLLTCRSSRSTLALGTAALLASAILPAAASAQGTFSDTFANPASTTANWGNESGGWAASNGVYNSANRSGFNFSTVTAAGDTNYATFTFSYDLINAADGGCVFHADAGANNALALIVRPGQNDAYFISRSGGTFGSVLGPDTTLGAGAGSSLHVIVSGQGNNYTAIISTLANPTVPIDTLTLNGNATAANFVSGRVGLYEYGGGAAEQFDNFTATVPEPGTWAGGALLLGTAGISLRRRSRAPLAA